MTKSRTPGSQSPASSETGGAASKKPLFWQCERDLDDLALKTLRPDDYKVFHAVDRLTRGNYPIREDGAISLGTLETWTGLHRNVVYRARRRLLDAKILKETKPSSVRGAARLAVNRDHSSWAYHLAGDTQQVIGITQQVTACHPAGEEGITHQVQTCHPAGDTSIEEIEEGYEKAAPPAGDPSGPSGGAAEDYYGDLGPNVRIGFVDRSTAPHSGQPLGAAIPGAAPRGDLQRFEMPAEVREELRTRGLLRACSSPAPPDDLGIDFGPDLPAEAVTA